MVSTWAKSMARIAWACAARICRQVGPDRRGAGSRPVLLRIVQTVDAAIGWPRPTSSPWIRLYPHLGFSLSPDPDSQSGCQAAVEAEIGSS
jgi:hypothetical protein